MWMADKSLSNFRVCKRLGPLTLTPVTSSMGKISAGRRLLQSEAPCRGGDEGLALIHPWVTFSRWPLDNFAGNNLGSVRGCDSADMEDNHMESRRDA